VRGHRLTDSPGKTRPSVTPAQIRSRASTPQAGAAIVYIHRARSQNTKPAWTRIYAKWSSVSVQVYRRCCSPHTGPGARFVHDRDDPAGRPQQHVARPAGAGAPRARAAPGNLQLDMGRLNMGSRVFINTPEHLQIMAVRSRRGRAARARSVREPATSCSPSA